MDYLRISLNKMDLLERDYHIALFDIYQELLTLKQQEYFIAYYYDDLSLAEIADLKGVSRNAIFDQLGKAIDLLKDYEHKLRLLEKKKKLIAFSDSLDETRKEALLSIIKE
jgi:predicted DNA-binding protein YlxM (UPF0122 family)